jgi:2'-5' RNA ligase
MVEADRRLFIALEPGDVVRRPIAQAESILRREQLDCRWVPPGNLHLTMRFLGSWSNSMVPAVVAAMKTAATEVSSFRSEATAFGAFPNAARARVLWLGIKKTAELSQASKRLNQELSVLKGLPEVRQFRAHITFGRTRGLVPVDLALLKGIDLSGQLKFKGLTLFESKLSPAGARYEIVYRAPFRGNSS